MFGESVLLQNLHHEDKGPLQLAPREGGGKGQVRG